MALSELVKMTATPAHQEIVKETPLCLLPGVKKYLKIPCQSKESPCMIKLRYPESFAEKYAQLFISLSVSDEYPDENDHDQH